MSGVALFLIGDGFGALHVEACLALAQDTEKPMQKDIFFLSVKASNF
jgi:hypothetical protein